MIIQLLRFQSRKKEPPSCFIGFSVRMHKIVFDFLCSLCYLCIDFYGFMRYDMRIDEYLRCRMNNYSSKQNGFFTASSCEAASFCACASDMKIMGIAAAMSVLLIIGVLSVLQAVRVCISLIIAVIIISMIVRSIVYSLRRTFQN